jgi:hypothetical protein
MEKWKYFLDMISNFVSGILPWSVVILIIFLCLKKPIKTILENLKFIEITKDGVRIKLLFNVVKEFIDIKEKSKRQIVPCSISVSKESDTSKKEILHIYSEIEATVKNKFEVTDINNMFVTLVGNGKIDTETFIILTSMELLRDEILSSTTIPKITKEYINNYRRNADKIIKIIQEIDD